VYWALWGVCWINPEFGRRSFFLPGWAKDLSAPPHTRKQTIQLKLLVHHHKGFYSPLMPVWSKCNMWYLLPTLVLERTSHTSSQLSHAAYSTCLTTTFLWRDRRWIWVLESKSQTIASRVEAVRQYRPVEEKVICLGGTACPSNFPVSIPNSRIRNRELDTLFRNRGCLIVSHWCASNLPMKNSAFWDMNSTLWNNLKHSAVIHSKSLVSFC